jgi:hypothetical protein
MRRKKTTLRVSKAALAGLTDALGGKSGAIRISLGNHEIGDLVASGQAYSLDGQYNFVDNCTIEKWLDWRQHYWDRLERRRDSFDARRKPKATAPTTWQLMATAPTDRTPVIVFAKRDNLQIVGEAYFDPEWHDGEGTWWWANESEGYYTDPIHHAGWTLMYWQPMPKPPIAATEQP